MTTKRRLQKSEWIQPIKKNYKFVCCDCDLVHKIDFRICSGRVQFRTARDQQSTTQRRRHWKKLYIAASFEMREKCVKLIEQLPKKTIVVSTWHRDDYTIDRKIRVGNLGSIVEQRILRDYDQIAKADLIVIFIGDNLSGGGRHTELGIALGMKKRIALIGEYDHNPFERMPCIRLYKTVNEFLESLDEKIK